MSATHFDYTVIVRGDERFEVSVDIAWAMQFGRWECYRFIVLHNGVRFDLTEDEDDRLRADFHPSKLYDPTDSE